MLEKSVSELNRSHIIRLTSSAVTGLLVLNTRGFGFLGCLVLALGVSLIIAEVVLIARLDWTH